MVLTSRTRKELEEVKREIEELGKGTEVRIVEVDLTDEESVDRLYEEAGEVDGEQTILSLFRKKEITNEEQLFLSPRQ